VDDRFVQSSSADKNNLEKTLGEIKGSKS